MTYDKEFEEMVKRVIGVCTTDEKKMIYFGWTEARKDHYRIGEEVESLDGTKKAKVCAVVECGRMYDLGADDVRRIPAKSRIDEIAEEAQSSFLDGTNKPLTEVIKSAILKDREERH